MQWSAASPQGGDRIWCSCVEIPHGRRHGASDFRGVCSVSTEGKLFCGYSALVKICGEISSSAVLSFFLGVRTTETDEACRALLRLDGRGRPSHMVLTASRVVTAT